MKLNRKILILILIILPVFTTGCWDSLDINKQVIVTTIALDFKDGEVYAYAEFANIKEGKSDEKGLNENKFIYVAARGKTIIEARENLERKFDKRLFTTGIRTIILSENFSKEHLLEYLYRIRADELYRNKTITVITKDDPEEILKKSNEKGICAGYYIENMLDSLEKQGLSFSRPTARIVENLSSSYTGILIPCIGLQDEISSLTGYSVIFDNKVTGFIPAENSRGLIFIKNGITRFSYNVSYNDNNLTIDVTMQKKKIKPSYENGAIKFDLEFKLKAKLKYGSKKTPYGYNQKPHDEINEILTKTIKDEIIQAIDQSINEFNCDYLQFDDEFRIKYPTVFDSIKWEDEYPKITYNVDVKMDLDTNWILDYETDKRG